MLCGLSAVLPAMEICATATFIIYPFISNCGKEQCSFPYYELLQSLDYILYTVQNYFIVTYITFSRQEQEIVYFARLLFISVYSSNRISCKVRSPSCFLLMDFWNLYSYCCTTSLGRQDFCGGVLPRVLQALETYHTLKILTSVVLPLVVQKKC